MSSRRGSPRAPPSTIAHSAATRSLVAGSRARPRGPGGRRTRAARRCAEAERERDRRPPHLAVGLDEAPPRKAVSSASRRSAERVHVDAPRARRRDQALPPGDRRRARAVRVGDAGDLLPELAALLRAGRRCRLERVARRDVARAGAERASERRRTPARPRSRSSRRSPRRRATATSGSRSPAASRGLSRAGPQKKRQQTLIRP